MHKLIYLNLDGNYFKKRIDGLSGLTQLSSLSLANIKMWDGSGTTALCKSIANMPKLWRLNICNSNFTNGGIPFSFVQTLQSQVVSYTNMSGNLIDMTATNASITGALLTLLSIDGSGNSSDFIHLDFSVVQ